jgi:hypothetical protein
MRSTARERGLAALVLALVLVFAALVTAENRARTLALRSTYPQDLGSFNNQAWNAAHGRDVSYLSMAAWFKPGDFDGPSVRRSAHFTPLRVLVLPLAYRLVPRIETAMFLQALAVGIGAIGLYGFAIARTRSAACGLVLVAAYLLHPAILNTSANDFREIVLGIGPALLALWLHATGRYRGFVLAALVTLAARSEWAVVVAAAGIVNYRLAPRRPLVSIGLPIALAAGWGVLAEVYYRHYYGVHWPLLAFASGESLATTVAQWAFRLVPFVKLMQLPALLALGAPEAAALAMPFVALAKRVHATEFPAHHLQHLAPAMAAVFWGFACAVTALWGRARTALAAIVLGASLVSFVVFARADWTAYPRELAPYEELGSWADALPPDATVVVPGALAARFSAHARVLDYENLPTSALTPEEGATVLSRVVASADFVVTREAPELETIVRDTGLFEPVGRFRLYKAFARRADAPRVADPDAVLQRALGWERLTPLQKRGASLADQGR